MTALRAGDGGFCDHLGVHANLNAAIGVDQFGRLPFRRAISCPMSSSDSGGIEFNKPRFSGLVINSKKAVRRSATDASGLSSTRFRSASRCGICANGRISYEPLRWGALWQSL